MKIRIRELEEERVKGGKARRIKKRNQQWYVHVTTHRMVMNCTNCKHVLTK